MKTYTVSLTLSVEAENENRAWKKFWEKVQANDFDSNTIEIDEEK